MYTSRAVRRFLIKWYELETNFNDLSPREIVEAKVLYSLLKLLNKDELKLITLKYRVEGKPKSDSDIAEELNLNHGAVPVSRRKIERKLMEGLPKVLGEYGKELQREIRLENHESLRIKMEQCKKPKDISPPSVVQSYLSGWYFLDSNMNHLTEVQTVQIKILYSLLKILNKNETEILASKYRVEERPYLKDSIVAERLDMTESEYGDKRREVELKLRKVFFEIHDRYRYELSMAIELEHSK